MIPSSASDTRQLCTIKEFFYPHSEEPDPRWSMIARTFSTSWVRERAFKRLRDLPPLQWNAPPVLMAQ
jgi:predicted RNA-binding protein with PUA-like domain